MINNILDVDYVVLILLFRKLDILLNLLIVYIIELVKKDYFMDYESMLVVEKLKYG